MKDRVKVEMRDGGVNKFYTVILSRANNLRNPGQKLLDISAKKSPNKVKNLSKTPEQTIQNRENSTKDVSRMFHGVRCTRYFTGNHEQKHVNKSPRYIDWKGIRSMGMPRYVSIDLFVNRVKAQNQKQLFKQVFGRIAPMSGSVSADTLLGACHRHFDSHGSNCDEGLAIFDMSSVLVKKPIVFVSTIETGIDIEQQDCLPVDIFAGVLSPQDNTHLQRLSALTRLFRAKELREALRESSSIDEMKVLFLPSQEWIQAA